MHQTNANISRLVAGSIALSCVFAHTLRAIDFAGGTGEPNDPYQIATAEQLIGLGQDPNLYDGHFILTADINLDPNLPNGQVFSDAVIAPVRRYSLGESDTVFSGTFNGNNHVIRNVTIDASPRDYRAALFGFVGSGGHIEALHLEAVTVSGGHSVAGLAGENRGTIVNCHVSGSIRGQQANIGGLVGRNGALPSLRSRSNIPSEVLPPLDSVEGLIYACATNVEVIGTPAESETEPSSSSAGGLVGTNMGGMIVACRSCGNVSADHHPGGLVGSNFSGWILSSYAATDVHANESSAGGLVGRNSGSMLFCYAIGNVTAGKEMTAGGLCASGSGAVYLSYWDVETTGVDFSNGGRPKTTSEMMLRETFRGWGYENVWALNDTQDYPRLAWEESEGIPLANEPIPYEVGTGTLDNPYEIATAEQLAGLAYHWSLFDRHFVLTDDIDMGKIDPNTSVPFGTMATPFVGSFDGGGHTITGLQLDSPYDNYVGLFGYIGPGGVVRNLLMADSNVHGRWKVGILAGSNKGHLVDCSVDGFVCGDNIVGGMLAMNEPNGAVVSCISSAEIVGRASAGGLVDNNQGLITACTSSATVTATDGSGGGLVYANTGIISSSYACATVHASHAGGLLAWNGIRMIGNETWVGEVLDCYCLGTVRGYAMAGGLVCTNAGIVRRCYCANTIGSEGVIRGFAAKQEDTSLAETFVESCYWDVGISGIETSAGGTGLTTAAMQTAETFLDAGWDFETVWMICEGEDYPRLRWEGVQCQE